MDIIIKNFYKSYDNLIYIKRNTMHKRKSIRILYVVHLFKYRGRKRVPIDIIKASGSRHQAKWRCLWLRKRRTYIESAGFCAFDVGGCVRRRTLTGPVGICFVSFQIRYAESKYKIILLNETILRNDTHK